MSDDADKQDPPSLKEFSARLDTARGVVEQQENRHDGRSEALGKGFRLASELIAAVIVGLALGLGIDALTGLAPLGLLAGLFLGFGAGLRNAAVAMLDKKTDEADGDQS